MSSPLLPIPGSSHTSDLDGHIQVIFGPMFSGKTTELMRRVRRYTHAKKRCLVIKYSKDLRYGAGSGEASTHDSQRCKAVPATVLSEVDPQLLHACDVLAIDEGQFFPDCVSFADRWASAGKVVIVAGLDATFERRPFGPILELVAVAEQVQKLSAVCMLCHREASFTKRIGSETAVEVIGGADKYLSTCRACFALEANSPTSANAERAAAALTEQQQPQAAEPAAVSSGSGASSPAAPCAALMPPVAADDDELLFGDAALDGDEGEGEDSGADSPGTPSRALASNKRVSVASLQPMQADGPMQADVLPAAVGAKRKLLPASQEVDASPAAKRRHTAVDKENAIPAVAAV